MTRKILDKDTRRTSEFFIKLLAVFHIQTLCFAMREIRCE